jgi:hypothetical protein
MKCSEPECSGNLRVSHTYTVVSRKFQRATCTECGSVYRLDIEATLVTARGEGAKAHAARNTMIECKDSSPSPF